jgi:hypothetical protein
MCHVVTHEDTAQRVYELDGSVLINQYPHLHHPGCRVVAVYIAREIESILGRVR